MPRILFITVDEQRFDALGATGGNVARTPRLDDIASQGMVYDRAYVNNVTCMPSRATMITGQHPATHGVYTNGVSLPLDAPSVAEYLHDAGYRTALLGKSHLQPVKGEPDDYWEVGSGARGDTGPYRGFEHVMISSHGKGVARNHYQVWMEEHCPEQYDCYLSQVGSDGTLNTQGGGHTAAIQVHDNHIAKEHYHSYWLADRCNDWLTDRTDDEDWFLWLSFGDPHHPYQPPHSEVHRVDWRALNLPNAFLGSEEEIVDVLDKKPAHWREYYEGIRYPAGEMPNNFVPKNMTENQVREINARVHVMNEIIDDSVGKVLDTLAARGWLDDTHIIYTSDHGSLQGDYGLLFKGPFHVDSLMRVPLIWRPARSAEFKPARYSKPVSLVDLAPTFCAAANLPKASWMQGQALPIHNDEQRNHIFCEWDQVHDGKRIHLSTLVTEEFICTRYEKTNRYQKSEGELYHYPTDPLQMNNLWDHTDYRAVRNTLLKTLDNDMPPVRSERLPRVASA